MKSWVSGGLDPAGFWGVTLREYTVIIDGVASRIEREHEDAKRVAYITGSINRSAYHAKRFPRYDAVFPDTRRKRQSQSDMIAAMRQWTAVLAAANKR